MEAFIFAANAVLPIIIIVAVGYIAGRTGLISGSVAGALNKIVFKLLLPCMLFINVYKIGGFGDIDLLYVIFALAVTVAVFFAAIPSAKLVTKDNSQRAALTQAVFRSNYALIGIPLATLLCGAEGAAVATVLSAFSIPLFNILAVICLSANGEGLSFKNVKKILIGIIKNPLIKSIAAGFVCLGARALFVKLGISWRLSDITPAYKAMEMMSASATPLALLCLGAQFRLCAAPALKKQIIFGVLARTVVVPTIAISLAVLLGCFRGAHFAAFIAMFGTPVAVSSVPMAYEMGADGELAGQLVVWTTVLSAFTIFASAVILKSAGIFT